MLTNHAAHRKIMLKRNHAGKSCRYKNHAGKSCPIKIMMENHAQGDSEENHASHQKNMPLESCSRKL
jgi:hypothetical protein